MVIFTKYDLLLRTKISELQEDKLPEELVGDQSKIESQNALKKCVELLERTVNTLKIPVPTYVTVSSTISHSLFDQC